MVGFVVQTAILFGILYLQPWYGDLGSEAKLVAAGVVAVVGSGVLFFLWDLVCAPVEIYKSHRAFIKELSEAILETQDKEAALKGLSERHSKGLAILRGSRENWRESLEAWEADFDDYLRTHFDHSLVHTLCSDFVVGYTKTDGNTTYVNHGSKTKRADDVSIFEYYADKLNKINSHIAYADTHYLGSKILNSMSFAANTIRRYGLPEHLSPKDTE